MINSKGYEENLYTPGCIRTNSGIYVDILNPTPEMFCIEDITHSLSNIPRFGGHLNKEYSVGQHCIECAAETNTENRFDALMHDCAEAYLGDMLSPIKQLIPEYKILEDKFLKILSEKFGFKYPFSDEVKRVDKHMLEFEWNNRFVNHIDFNVPSKNYVKDAFIYIFNSYNPKV